MRQVAFANAGLVLECIAKAFPHKRVHLSYRAELFCFSIFEGSREISIDAGMCEVTASGELPSIEAIAEPIVLQLQHKLRTYQEN